MFVVQSKCCVVRNLYRKQFITLTAEDQLLRHQANCGKVQQGTQPHYFPNTEIIVYYL